MDTGYIKDGRKGKSGNVRNGTGLLSFYSSTINGIS